MGDFGDDEVIKLLILPLIFKLYSLLPLLSSSPSPSLLLPSPSNLLPSLPFSPSPSLPPPPTPSLMQYPNMVCVEAGYVSQPYSLPAGQTFRAAQKIENVDYDQYYVYYPSDDEINYDF